MSISPFCADAYAFPSNYLIDFLGCGPGGWDCTVSGRAYNYALNFFGSVLACSLGLFGVFMLARRM